MSKRNSTASTPVDFRVENHGNTFLVALENKPARQAVLQFVDPGAQWFDDALHQSPIRWRVRVVAAGGWREDPMKRVLPFQTHADKLTLGIGGLRQVQNENRPTQPPRPRERARLQRDSSKTTRPIDGGTTARFMGRSLVEQAFSRGDAQENLRRRSYHRQTRNIQVTRWRHTHPEVRQTCEHLAWRQR